MKRVTKTLLVGALALLSFTVSAAERGFAIVIDPVSYKEAKAEVDAYAASVEKQGLKTYIVEDVWYNPDSIRAKVRELATQKTSPIEGVVFIGDIPVAMVRDAQHMTSAFKPKQTDKNMEFSSVPTDRFYDDFDLDFEFIKTDEKKPNLFYYSLTAESEQTCSPEIYSARIKTCDKGNQTKYDRLKAYLKKVIAQKEKCETLSQLFYFAGSGYNSDCSLARVDEKASYYELFPYMRSQSWSIVYQNHADDIFSKYPLMTQMQRKDLSLAILHHHGFPDTEYLNADPVPNSAHDNLKAAKTFFNSKIRTAVRRGKDTLETVNYYKTNYDVPAHWFDSVFDPKSIEEDSIFADQLDLHITDFGKYQPNAKVVILDACYNGAFNEEAYIAEEYIFEGGDCVISIANSVNSLQDKWCDRNIGMFAFGMRVGNFVKYNPYLESHIFGDPTFTFAPSYKVGFDVNKALSKGDKFWKKQLKSEYPAIQAFAINELYLRGAITSGEILKIFETSPNQTVRLMALMTLSNYKDGNYVSAMILGLNDNSELVRRFAVVHAGKCGDERLIPSLVSLFAKESIGARVKFQLNMALALFPYDKLVAEFKKQDPCKYNYNAAKESEKTVKSFEKYSDKSFDEDIESLFSKELSPKQQINVIRSFRNRPLHPATDKLFEVFENLDDVTVQVTLAETMGWFNTSYKRVEIANYFKAVSENEKYDKAVRSEALKTHKRLLGL